jgi:glycosyltransferase involved in cell wall biosynthesis
MTNRPSILILHPQVPFARGGIEQMATVLRSTINGEGFPCEIVTVPFRWEPKELLIKEMITWRMLDLDAAMVVPLRFPAYAVRHDNKVPLLNHQHRQLYELFGTPLSGFSNNLPDGELRQRLVDFDTRCLSECRALYTTSENARGRLRTFNGLDGTVLYVPPLLHDRLRQGDFGEYFLAVGRLEEAKRFDLAIRAIAAAREPVRLKIVGVGSQADSLRALARELGVEKRVEFLGFVEDEDLVRLYADCRAVHFAPFDEDYGFITIEAMASGKAVVTAEDSGGPLEFVRHEENGFVLPPEPENHAEVLDRLWQDDDLCRELGQKAAGDVAHITWDRVLEELLQWLP